MKRTHIASLALFGFMMVGLLAFMATTVRGLDKDEDDTEVDIDDDNEDDHDEDIIIVSGDNLNFGKLSAPSDFAAIWTLNNVTGDLTLIGGNSVDFVGGDHNRGSFIISGDPLASVNYGVAVTTNFTGPGLSLAATPLVLTQVLLGAGGDVEVFVGGVLTISTTAVSGTYSDAIITITVDY